MTPFRASVRRLLVLLSLLCLCHLSSLVVDMLSAVSAGRVRVFDFGRALERGLPPDRLPLAVPLINQHSQACVLLTRREGRRESMCARVCVSVTKAGFLKEREDKEECRKKKQSPRVRRQLSRAHPFWQCADLQLPSIHPVSLHLAPDPILRPCFLIAFFPPA